VTLVVTVYVREGIVMASDSRMTLNVTQMPQVNLQPPTSSGQQGGAQPAQPAQLLLPGVQIVQFAATQSDSTYKTFLAPANIGISTFGAADIQGVPITDHIESFIAQKQATAQPSLDVDQVPGEVLAYFLSMPAPPNTEFHVAGIGGGLGRDIVVFKRRKP
jgi:hypothetical protein